MVKRSFNRNWFSNWHWLHYDSSQDLSFCHTCVKAVNEGKLSLASGNIKALSVVGFPTGRMLLLPLHAMSKLPHTRKPLKSLLRFLKQQGTSERCFQLLMLKERRLVDNAL